MTENHTVKIEHWLRALVLVIGAVETLVFAGFAWSNAGTPDPSGHAMGEALVGLAAIPFVLLTIPGIILGVLDRARLLALVLVLFAGLVLGALWLV